MDHNHRRMNSAAMPYGQPGMASGMSRHQQTRHRQGGGNPADTCPYYEYIESYEKMTPSEPSHQHQAYRIVSGGSSRDRIDGHCVDPSYAQPRSRAYSSPFQEDRRPLPVTSHSRGVSHAGYTIQGRPQPETLPRSRPLLRRSDSGSSLSSYASATTPPTDRSSWSTSTTPESMSPTSPHNRPLVQSPLRKSSKGALMMNMGELSPDTYQPPTVARPAKPVRTCSRSASRRFQNTPIETPVLEEDETIEKRRSRQVEKAHEGKDTRATISSDAHRSGILHSAEVPVLHQKQQEQQLNPVAYTAFPQPSKATGSTLPPLPSPAQSLRSSSAPSTSRRLNRAASRSLPQLRACIGPPPSEPLPPLPPVPQISPMFPPSPTTPTISTADAPPFTSPITPTSEASLSPPAPTLPPPPPPAAPRAASPTDETKPAPISKDNAPLPPIPMDRGTTGRTPAPAPLPKKQHQVPRKPVQTAERWEQELQHHKQFLKNLPTQPQPPRERLKLSRSYKSLGNLRARARAHSTPTGHDDIVTASGIVHTSGDRLKSCKTPKVSAAKAGWDPVASRLDEPLPALPKVEVEPIVSVFEDDSDDEGDTVRRFVRNIFTRRIRSNDVVATVVSTEKPTSRDGGSISSNSTKNNKTDDANHNSRKKNYSTSSSFSMATTVGASTVASSTTTIAPTISEASSMADSESTTNTNTNNTSTNSAGSVAETGSSRSSTEQPRPQRGPLLTRMFVRRSH